ncbi:MAG TPA: methyltransferase domain-containing protein [Mycobacterium sp.]|nr:methyltransferase domain-containing protein [Mycobacterium sp.]
MDDAAFADERARAFVDLTTHIDAISPRHVVDVGCGRGDLTGLLARRWPQAAVEGVDSSRELVVAAWAAGESGVSFSAVDLTQWQPGRDVDVIVCSDLLQTMPLHLETMAMWAAGLPPGGWLAVQIPDEHDSAAQVLMRRLADSERWAPALRDVDFHANHVASATSYAEVLLDAGLLTDVWTTTYLDVLHGEDPVLDWLRCTALAPLLEKLSSEDAEQFCTHLGANLRAAYPPGAHGTVMPIRRVFAVGLKP